MNPLFKLLFVSAFILLLILGMVKTVPAASGQEPLIVAMEATGAQVEEVSINAWLKLPNKQWSDNQLVDIVQQVMRDLNVEPLSYELTQQEKNKQYSIQAEAVSPNCHMLAIVRGMPKGLNSSEREYYLVITIEEKTRDNLSVSHMEREIRRISEKFGSSPHISTCLIGWLNGTLRDGEQQDLLQKAFAVIDAKIIDKLEAEHFVSYTGFALGIIEWLQVGDQKINLNMAMRHSQYDNRTYVTIGSPVITREY